MGFILFTSLFNILNPDAIIGQKFLSTYRVCSMAASAAKHS